MRNAIDIEKYRNLIKKAIGVRTQKEFADAAGLSEYGLNHMLNDKKIRKPQKATLKKIADASEGRVTEAQLYEACGLESRGSTLSDSVKNAPAKEFNITAAINLKNAIESMCSDPVKYDSIETFCDTAVIIAGLKAAGAKAVRWSYGEEKEYIGVGHKGSEQFRECRVAWHMKDYDCKLSFILMYCKTAKGIIVLDGIFDMDTMVDFDSKYAMQEVFRLSEKGDVCYGDYPIVFSCERHVPGDAEIRLLKAIFGEDYDAKK